MSALSAPLDFLAFLGRQGTRAVAASVVLGVAVPPLAAVMKPLLAPSVIALLVVAFLRVDVKAFRADLVDVRRGPLGTLWTMVALPLVLGALFATLGAAWLPAGLVFALILQAAAPPIMSSPAFAALMGLPAALPLAVLVLSMVATPATAPFFVDLYAEGAAGLSPVALGIRLFSILAGSAIAAFVLRRLIGEARIAGSKSTLDGLNVVLLFIFAVSLMDGVAAAFIAEPLKVIGITALSFALSLGLVGATFIAFGGLGRAQAFALGLAAGHRNMGLMIAATGAALPEIGLLYFALAQFPIYLLPQLMKPLARRLVDPPQG